MARVRVAEHETRRRAVHAHLQVRRGVRGGRYGEPDEGDGRRDPDPAMSCHTASIVPPVMGAPTRPGYSGGGSPGRVTPDRGTLDRGRSKPGAGVATRAAWRRRPVGFSVAGRRCRAARGAARAPVTRPRASAPRGRQHHDQEGPPRRWKTSTAPAPPTMNAIVAAAAAPSAPKGGISSTSAMTPTTSVADQTEDARPGRPEALNALANAIKSESPRAPPAGGGETVARHRRTAGRTPAESAAARARPRPRPTAR